MKRIFGLLFASALSLIATAQQYNMSTTSVSTCSGYFYDPGGAANNAVNQIQLVDVTGRVMFEQSTNGQAQVTLSMKALPSGIYLLRTVGGTSETVRVVKE